jgi:hypothetical protein
MISEMHDEETNDVKIALKFYNRFTKHIEISFNEKLVRVYFSLDPYTFYLTSNTEKILREQEYMETSAEKLRKF